MAGPVVLYASAHGLGHLTRMVALGRALSAAGHAVVVIGGDGIRRVAGSPSAQGLMLVESPLDAGFVARPGGFGFDLEATRARLDALARVEAERLAGEVQRLSRLGARAVIADAPALALEAAHRCGLPSAIVGNFTWADMYGERFGRSLRERLERAYAGATVALRLWPGGLAMAGARRVEDVPGGGELGVLCRTAAGDVAALRERLLAGHAGPLVAVGMGRGLDWDPGPLCAAIERQGGRAVLATAPEELAAAELVIAKAGYSTIAEALAASRPLVAVPVEDSLESQAIASDVAAAGVGVEVGFGQLAATLESEGLLGLAARARPQRPVCDAAPAVVSALGREGLLA